MGLKQPILAVNFKTYPTAYGEAALKITKAAEEVYRDTGVTIILAPPATEIRKIAEVTNLPVFAQHVDPVELGAFTGHLPPEIVRDAGAQGFIINHSERRLRIDEIAKLISRARVLGLKVLACADVPEVAAAISVLNPDLIAIEPPELIGTGIAVSKAKPEVILNTVKSVRRVNSDVIILTGAGISDPEDVAKAIELGTSGVLVASAIMKAKDPKRAIADMAKAALSAYSQRS